MIRKAICSGFVGFLFLGSASSAVGGEWKTFTTKSPPPPDQVAREICNDIADPEERRRCIVAFTPRTIDDTLKRFDDWVRRRFPGAAAQGGGGRAYSWSLLDDLNRIAKTGAAGIPTDGITGLYRGLRCVPEPACVSLWSQGSTQYFSFDQPMAVFVAEIDTSAVSTLKPELVFDRTRQLLTAYYPPDDRQLTSTTADLALDPIYNSPASVSVVALVRVRNSGNAANPALEKWFAVMLPPDSVPALNLTLSAFRSRDGDGLLFNYYFKDQTAQISAAEWPTFLAGLFQEMKQ